MSKLYEDVTSWMESFWILLFCIAYNLNSQIISVQKRHHISEFVMCIQYLLPCKQCRPYYKKYLEKHPLSLEQPPIDYVSYVSKLLGYIMRKSFKDGSKCNRLSMTTINNALEDKCKKISSTSTRRNPNVWGYSTWIFLHCISYAYPRHPSKKDQQHHLQFYNCLKEVLPCRICRVHLRQYLKSHSLETALHTRNGYIDYVIQMHNYINKHFTGKKEISLQTARRNILQNCKREQLKTKTVDPR